MCDSCGCNVTHGDERLPGHDGALSFAHSHSRSDEESVEVLKGLLDANDRRAAHNREHLARQRVLAVNLMSSPGAGKTALLEATIERLGERYGVAVIVGDLETQHDAERIRKRGVTAIQISTGSACHLDAHMVHAAFHELDLRNIDIVFIENVGNLVCPASFDLGQHRNVILLSSPEGDDKPSKYPVMFRAADLMLLTKSDLTAMLGDFDPQRATHCLRQLANEASVIELSARSGYGIQAWCDWLDRTLELHRANVQPATVHRNG